MSLKQISSIAELRMERQRLLAEKSYAYNAIAENFSTEKNKLVDNLTSRATSVQQGIMSGGDEVVGFFEKWKIPALGSIAALIGILFTTWLTDEDEDYEHESPEGVNPDDSEEEQAIKQEYYDADGKVIPPNIRVNRDAPLEERVYAAMKAFKEEEATGAEKGAFLTILGVLAPVLLRQLLSGNLIGNIERIMGSPAAEKMQDLSNSIADQMEVLQKDLVD